MGAACVQMCTNHTAVLSRKGYIVPAFCVSFEFNTMTYSPGTAVGEEPERSGAVANLNIVYSPTL